MIEPTGRVQTALTPSLLKCLLRRGASGWVAVSLLGTLGAACSSDAADEPLVTQAMLEDPCRLLDRADVEAVLGERVTEPFNPFFPPFTVLGMRFCGFRSESGSSAQVGLATAYPRRVFERFRQANPEYSQFRGFGEEAVRHNEIQSILVLEDDAVVGVTVFFTKPTPYQQERADRLTSKALERLSP